MNILFSSHILTLHPTGALLWPQHKMAVISDLHLEKGSHFAKRGFFLPPYDSQETLERALKLCRDESIERLVILGDCFHDAHGYHRLPEKAHDLFRQLLAFNPIWIKGNHDADFVPEGLVSYDAYMHDGLVFRHQAEENALNEISGHFHPKFTLDYKGARITRACFIEDGRKMLLPAFGAYAGGLATDHEAIKALFTDPRYYVPGDGRVYAVKQEQGSIDA